METKAIILLADNNEELTISNANILRSHGYAVLAVRTAADAELLLAENCPDIILTGTTLADTGGFDFVRKIRGQTSAHILFLAAESEHKDIVRGLGAGADCYITLPLHPEELLARIGAVMRRRSMSNPQVITIGSLVLDIAAFQAFMNGVSLELAPKEFALTFMLARNEGKVISTECLYEAVWKAPLTGDKNALQTAVCKLRQKLEPAGYTVAAVRGHGYYLHKE